MNLAQWIWGGAKSPRPTNAFRLFVLLLVAVGGLWLAKHNFYLDVVGKQARRESSVFARYVDAERVSDLPANRLVRYECFWKARNGVAGISPVVTRIRFVESTHAPHARLAVWMDKDAYVRQALVCGDHATTNSCQLLVDSASRLIGRRLRPGELIDALQPTALDDTRALFNRTVWRKEGRLVVGDPVSIPDSASELILESPITGPGKSAVWFYWLADKSGRIVERGMMGS